MIHIVIFALAAIAGAQPQVNLQDYKIKNTLDSHDRSETLLEWESSPFHPHQIFEELERQIYPKDVVDNLCREISSLNANELNVFLGELVTHQAQLNNVCINRQIERGLAKVTEYQITSLFIEKVTEVKPSSLSLQFYQSVLGPSRQKSVEVNGGPIFNYGSKGYLESNEFALTFDDGPHPRLTDKLLDILAAENVSATFFMVGKNARNYPEIVQRVLDRGHTVATHSYSHKNLPTLSHSAASEEIELGFTYAMRAVSLVAPFFRFPYGSKNTWLTNYVRTNDLASFFWDVDTLDWKKKDPAELLEFAFNETLKVRKGIILFHDVQPQTISMMPAFLGRMKKSELKTVVYTPSEWMQH